MGAPDEVDMVRVRGDEILIHRLDVTFVVTVDTSSGESKIQVGIPLPDGGTHIIADDVSVQPELPTIINVAAAIGQHSGPATAALYLAEWMAGSTPSPAYLDALRTGRVQITATGGETHVVVEDAELTAAVRDRLYG